MWSTIELREIRVFLTLCENFISAAQPSGCISRLLG
jgi:hypothetical protein